MLCRKKVFIITCRKKVFTSLVAQNCSKHFLLYLMSESPGLPITLFHVLLLVPTCTLKSSSRRRRLFGRTSNPGQTQTGLEPKVYLLLPQAALLAESDAGSDVVKPASSFVIQNRQTSCFMWCPMYGARYYNVVCGLFRNAALAIW